MLLLSSRATPYSHVRKDLEDIPHLSGCPSSEETSAIVNWISSTPHIFTPHVLVSLSIEIGTCPVTVSSLRGFVVHCSNKQHQSALTLSKDFSNHPQMYKIELHMGSLINGTSLEKQTKPLPQGDCSHSAENGIVALWQERRKTTLTSWSVCPTQRFANYVLKERKRERRKWLLCTAHWSIFMDFILVHWHFYKNVAGKYFSALVITQWHFFFGKIHSTCTQMCACICKCIDLPQADAVTRVLKNVCGGHWKPYITKKTQAAFSKPCLPNALWLYLKSSSIL